MNKTLLGVSASAYLVTAISGALAADPTDYTPAQVYDWSGPYVGVHRGYMFSRSDWNVGPGSPVSIAPDGFLGGALIGYNLQFHNFVLGLEGDVSVGDIDEGPSSLGIAGQQAANVNYLATVRARLGYAFDNWMIFATAGLGIADLELYDSAQAARDRQVLSGYVAGAGIEAKLDDMLNISTNGALTGRVEYMYGNYGNENFQIGAVAEPADLETHTVRAALIWQFAGTSQTLATATNGNFTANPAQVSDWSGLYTGSHLGYAFSKTDWNVGPGFPVSIKPDGFLGGALVGYNLQFNSFVFGLEGDVSVGDIDEGPSSLGIGGLQSANVNYLATIRGRLGYAFDDWMIFATAGLGIADLELYDTLGGGPLRDRQVLTGFVAGAGVETKLDGLLNIDTDDALIGRVEYMYGNYGSENFQIGATAEPADLESHTVRAALVWRFNGTGGLFQ